MVVCSEARKQSLSSALQRQPPPSSALVTRERYRPEIALAEGTIKLRISSIEGDASAQDLVHGCAVDLIPVAPCISRPIGFTNGGVENDVPHRFHMHAHAQSLIQHAVQQASGNELLIGCGHIAKIVVINVKGNSCMG